MTRREAIAALTAMPAVTRLTRARVQPTDVIVVECDGEWSMEAKARIAAQIREIFQHDRVAVLDRGLRLTLLEVSHHDAIA